MRQCGECTLCCKIPCIPSLAKPSDRWCPHCDIGKGCKVYSFRPKACVEFRCLWLDNDAIKEEHRPDKIHFYVSGKLSDETLKIRVDTDFSEAWRLHPVVNDLNRDNHLLIVIGRQLTFLPAESRPIPEKIALDWTL
jgi:hypothetical protein